jgi:transcription initiation factor TFIIIB Brf1 subunit/transcription initiation factor TFIIB
MKTKGLLCPECGRRYTMKEHNVAEVKCYICGAIARVRVIHETIAVPAPPSATPLKRTAFIVGWDL